MDHKRNISHVSPFPMLNCTKMETFVDGQNRSRKPFIVTVFNHFHLKSDLRWPPLDPLPVSVKPSGFFNQFVNDVDKIQSQTKRKNKGRYIGNGNSK